MKIEITNYNDVDYDIVKEMIFELYKEDNDGQDKVTMTESKINNTINWSKAHPEQLKIKVFKVNNLIVGYSTLTFFWSNEYSGLVIIIDELYVLPQYRSNGIGMMFINELLIDKNYKLLNLEVFKHNTRAIELYRKLGFEVIDRLFMKKEI